MNAPDRSHDWTEANQRLLVAEFARLKRAARGATPSARRADVRDAPCRAARAGRDRPARASASA